MSIVWSFIKQLKSGFSKHKCNHSTPNFVFSLKYEENSFFPGGLCGVEKFVSAIIHFGMVAIANTSVFQLINR